MALIRSIFERLREEPSVEIRVNLLGVLERLLRVKKPTTWHELIVTGEEVEEFVGWFVSLAEAAKKSKKIRVNELLFIALAFIGANDFDASVRLAAVNLIGRLEKINAHLIAQACKKDLLVNHAFPLKLSVLACGVFAHGIEEQFMKLRLASLNSLYALSAQIDVEDERSFSMVLSVFVDAWLDECDWIRLASLKLTSALLSKRPMHRMQLDGPLEALLAALDDFNEEIRSEALKLLGCVRTVENDAFLRTQRCLKALILKYEEEVHVEALQCAFNFASLNIDAIKQDKAMLSHLLCTPDVLFFAPSLDPSALSTVHQAFLIPILASEPSSNAQAKQLAFNLGARFNVPALEKYIYWKYVDFSKLPTQIHMVASYPQREIDAAVRKKTDLDCEEQERFYFPGPTYCRFRRLRCDPSPEEQISVDELKWIQVEIGDFHVIGSIENVKIGIKNDQDASSVVSGTIPVCGFARFKVPVKQGTASLTLRIVNLSNNQEMSAPLLYSFSNKS